MIMIVIIRMSYNHNDVDCILCQETINYARFNKMSCEMSGLLNGPKDANGQ